MQFPLETWNLMGDVKLVLSILITSFGLADICMMEEVALITL